MIKLHSFNPIRWLTVLFSLLYLWSGVIGQGGWVVCFESDGQVALEQALSYDSPVCSDKYDTKTTPQPGVSAACKRCVDVPLGHLSISQVSSHQFIHPSNTDHQNIPIILEQTKVPVGYLAFATTNLLPKPPPVLGKQHLVFLQTIRLII